MFAASASGHLAVMEILLAVRANMEAADNRGEEPRCGQVGLTVLRSLREGIWELMESLNLKTNYRRLLWGHPFWGYCSKTNHFFSCGAFRF